MESMPHAPSLPTIPGAVDDPKRRCHRAEQCSLLKRFLVQSGTFQALCNSLSAFPQLRILDVRIKCGHLGDSAIEDLGRAASQLPCLQRLYIDVSMNSVTILDPGFAGYVTTANMPMIAPIRPASR